MQRTKSKKTVKKTFLEKGWVFNYQALCGKIGCHWGDCGRKVWGRWVFPSSWELQPLGKGRHLIDWFIVLKICFYFKLFSSTLLTLSVREAVQSPYRAITLNGNQILRSRTDLQGMIWEWKMDVERPWCAWSLGKCDGNALQACSVPSFFAKPMLKLSHFILFKCFSNSLSFSKLTRVHLLSLPVPSYANSGSEVSIPVWQKR